MNDDELDEVRLKMGMVFQSFNLFNNMTVLENCMVGQVKVLGKNKEEAKATALKYLKHVGMDSYVNAKPHQLSGGQKQRVAIARAFLKNAPIVVLDIMRLIKQMRDDEGVTVLLVEQNVKQSLKTANRAYVLDNGQVAASGKSSDLLSSEEIRKAYLGI